MHSVLLRVVRLFLRIWGFHVSARCKLTTTTMSSTMLSYLTVTRPLSDPGSLSSPRRETCQQLWPRTSWSLMCRALLYFPLCGYTFTYRSVYMCCRWHSISSFNQLPKVPVVSFCTATRLLPQLFPHPHVGSQVGHVPPLPEALEKARVTSMACWKFPAPNAPPLCLPSSSCRWLHL